MAAQRCLDEIHRLSLAVGGLASTSSGVRRRALVGLLTELQGAATGLFASGGSDVKTCDATLRGVQDVVAKLGLLNSKSSSSSPSREKEAAENALLVKLETEEDLEMLALSYILRSVRQMESSFGFQLNLWQDKQLLSQALGTPEQNLTYGTTSFQLWTQVMRCKPVRERLSCRRPVQKVLIFGSSLGLLAFMTSSLYPETKIVGYEILPTLHRTSQALKAAYMPNSNISFRLQDMLTADVGDADVVILTSLLWDATTRQNVARKLASEARVLPPPIVIDYRSDTFSLFGLDVSSGYYGRRTASGQAKLEAHRRADSAVRRADDLQLVKHLAAVLLKYERRRPGTIPPSELNFQLEDQIVGGAGAVSWAASGSSQSICVFTVPNTY